MKIITKSFIPTSIDKRVFFFEELKDKIKVFF